MILDLAAGARLGSGDLSELGDVDPEIDLAARDLLAEAIRKMSTIRA